MKYSSLYTVARCVSVVQYIHKTFSAMYVYEHILHEHKNTQNEAGSLHVYCFH